MQSIVRIMVADEDRLFTRLLYDAFQPSRGFCITGVSDNCASLLEAMQHDNPDVLLFDPMLPGGNILLLLRQLDQLHIRRPPHMIAISSFVSNDMSAAYSQLGVSFLLRKPVEVHAVADVVSNCIRNAPRPPRPTDHEILLYITKILDSVQFPTHVLGYHYVRECIMLTLRSNTPAISVTKILYPSVAKDNLTTWTSVERDIRNGISLAWDSCGGTFLGFNFSHRPTNREFISATAERVRFDLQLDFA